MTKNYNNSSDLKFSVNMIVVIGAAMVMITMMMSGGIGPQQYIYGQGQAGAVFDESLNKWVSSNTDGAGQYVDVKEWINYTSPNLGFSIEYPSNWELYEKSNRFLDLQSPAFSIRSTIDGLTATDQDAYILVLVDEKIPLNIDVRRSGLENYTNYMLPIFATTFENITLIEGVNMTKYMIGGYETATYLSVQTLADGFPIVVRDFFVNHDGRVWHFMYKGTTLGFDSPESQEIMERIISSIRFL